MTHTPGPWRVETETERDEYGTVLAGPYPAGIRAVSGEWIVRFDDDYENVAANARLIAAAPEMYALLDWFAHNDTTTQGAAAMALLARLDGAGA